MPRRELRSVRTDEPIGGAVEFDAGTYRFTGDGERYLSSLIKGLGSVPAAARDVFEHGASNGYWYFYPVPPDPALP